MLVGHRSETVVLFLLRTFMSSLRCRLSRVSNELEFLLDRLLLLLLHGDGMIASLLTDDRQTRNFLLNRDLGINRNLLNKVTEIEILAGTALTDRRLD